MEYSLVALGQVIQEHRVANGLTQDELGSAAGYRAGAGVSISRIENGLTRPGRDRFTGIALALGLTPDQLESAAEERTRDISAAQGGTGGPATSSAGGERLDDRSKRLRQEVKRRDAVISELYGAFNEAHDRARDEFFMTLVEIASGIDGAPQPDPVKPEDHHLTDAEAEAAFRLRFALRGVANVLAGGAQFAATGAAPSVGRLAAYGTFRAVVSMGRASTGKAISDLHGVAATNASYARLGRGPLANGGAGIAGGKRVLTGIEVGTDLLLAVIASWWTAKRNLKKQQELTAELDRIDAEISATQRGFEALEDILPRATKVLDDIAVHGARALNRWDARMGPRPLRWDSLDPTQRQLYQDFVRISACQLAVASINFQELMESTGDDREGLIESSDEVLNRSQEVVGALV